MQHLLRQIKCEHLFDRVFREGQFDRGRKRQEGVGMGFFWTFFSEIFLESFFSSYPFFFYFSNNLESAYPIQGASILLDCSAWEITVIWDVTKKVPFPFSLSILVRIMSIYLGFIWGGSWIGLAEEGHNFLELGGSLFELVYVVGEEYDDLWRSGRFDRGVLWQY